MASIVIIQLVQFGSANLLLMAKDRDLFSRRNHVKTINLQLMSDQFKIVVLLFYFAANGKKTFYDRIIMYVCFCVRVWIHMHMYIYTFYANTYIMYAACLKVDRHSVHV